VRKNPFFEKKKGFFLFLNRIVSEGGKKMNLQEIYPRQHQRVYRMAMLYLKNIQDAEDVVQTVFLKWIQREVDFQSEEHENAWFITVTRNCCRDLLRTFWRRKVDLGEIPEREFYEKEEGEVLLEILKLPPKYREVIYFYYYEEYSIREIAVLLHRKESTIQTQLSTARKKLKLQLEREETNYG
jgi:RNA polymerase sigma-70 factor (ECF subfamily)